MKRKIVAGVGILLAATSVMAVEVPNQFEAGQPALASEVNANFNAVANAAEDNSTNVMLVSEQVDANAADIADLKAANAGSNSPALNFHVFDGSLNNLGTLLSHGGRSVTFITDTGFIFNEVDVITGKQASGGRIFYKSTDCSWGATGQYQFVMGQGPSTIFDVGGQMYYVAKGATPTNINANSASDGTTCVQVTSSGQFYRATANNPAVTSATVSPVGGAPFTFSKK